MTDTTRKPIPIYNDDIGRAYRNGYEKGKMENLPYRTGWRAGIEQGRKEMADEIEEKAYSHFPFRDCIKDYQNGCGKCFTCKQRKSLLEAIAAARNKK